MGAYAAGGKGVRGGERESDVDGQYDRKNSCDRQDCQQDFIDATPRRNLRCVDLSSHLVDRHVDHINCNARTEPYTESCRIVGGFSGPTSTLCMSICALQA